MTELVFRWDSKKETYNRETHGVSFEEAKSVFLMRKPDLSMIRTIHLMKNASSFLVLARP
jgi:uncharacterized DUF497 family protein